MAIYQFLIEKEITIAISPRGMDYFETKPENIVLINLDGNIIEGLRKPSSEAKMHILIYKNRSDANSVVHTHSTFATTIATLNWEIPPLHYLVAFDGLKVPVQSMLVMVQLNAENVVNALGKDYKTTLLSNHGLISVGYNIE